MKAMKDYPIKLLKGITDLKGNLPEHGATDWWTQEQWDEWYKTLPEKLEWNKKYIEACKADGTYGEEYFITLRIAPNPIFDTPQLFNGSKEGFPLESYRMILITPKQNDDESNNQEHP